jgi:heme-degrading monooxygenase HmoA
MYVVQNRINSPASEAFEAHFAESLRNNLKDVVGLQRAALLKPTGDDQPYVATMEFESKDAFLAWMRSDSFRAAHGNADAPGMQAPASVEAYTVVEDVRF